jgi:hypothetical protein
MEYGATVEKLQRLKYARTEKCMQLKVRGVSFRFLARCNERVVGQQFAYAWLVNTISLVFIFDSFIICMRKQFISPL